MGVAGLNIAVRFGLYLDLMLLFGTPAFVLYCIRGSSVVTASALPVRLVMIVTAAIGIALTVVGVGVMAASMSGSDLASIGNDVMQSVLMATAYGTAALVRLAALGLALLIMLLATNVRWGMLAALPFAASALGSLAWSGHAAMTDSLFTRVHLFADILHLWAAGAWIGALASLLILIGLSGRLSVARGTLLHNALAVFALPGSVLVATLILTGVINSWVLVGPAHLIDLPQSRYGQLLLIKLALFGVMLGLAALNRFRLTPALQTGLVGSNVTGSALRLSLSFETALAWAILALVAWLGTLVPPSSLQ